MLIKAREWVDAEVALSRAATPSQGTPKCREPKSGDVMEWQDVLTAATRIANDDECWCEHRPPCATSDRKCRCLRLAKLALGWEGDVTAAHDAAEVMELNRNQRQKQTR